MKLCKKCNETKNLNLENFIWVKQTNNWHSWCRACTNANQKIYSNKRRVCKEKPQKASKKKIKDYIIDPNELFRAQLAEMMESNRGYV